LFYICFSKEAKQKQKQNKMTYEIAKEIANGNTDLLNVTFVTLVKMAQDSGMNREEAKREAKAILNCMVNAWNKVN